MIECSRKFFLMNQQLYGTSLFADMFHPPVNYIYEVFRVSRKIPLFIEDHIERFFHTAKLSAIEIDFSKARLAEYIDLVISNNPSEDGNMKIACYLQADGSVCLFLYFTPHAYPTEEEYTNGVNVDLYFAERKNPNAKVMNIEMRHSTDEAKHEQGVYELLLVDNEGFITEGSRSNVFFIKNNLLITPPADTVLEGITRKQILGLCRENNIVFQETKVHFSELTAFETLFISGTSRRVLPVKKVDNLGFSVANKLLRRLQLLFDKKVTDYLNEKTGSD
ncbi:MAG: branched-chain amino acid [Bacteroidetes bacterium]|nr:MAG: branched-chain amino acid [Bacteroidota bacterium]